MSALALGMLEWQASENNTVEQSPGIEESWPSRNGSLAPNGAQPVKRGRGRPPKFPRTGGSTTPPVQKRKRGRPSRPPGSHLLAEQQIANACCLYPATYAECLSLRRSGHGIPSCYMRSDSMLQCRQEGTTSRGLGQRVESRKGAALHALR